MEMLVGAFELLVIIAIPCLIAWLILKARGGANAVAQRKRNRQIETAMLLGMRDANAQTQIARALYGNKANRRR